MKTPSVSQSRRQFLKRSFLTTAPFILPSGMWGASLKGSGPNSRINVGMIGVGKRMHSLYGALSSVENTQLIAASDCVDARLEDGATRAQAAYAKREIKLDPVKQFKDFQELLAMEGMDAVLISTPDHWHAIQAIQAARKGLHVYCEKPLTRTIGEGRAVVSAARDAGITFQTGSQQRTEYGGKFRQAVEYIRNGRIGELKQVYVGVGGPPYPCDLPEEDLPPGIDWEAWLGPAPMRGFNQVLCPIGVHNHFPRWRDYTEYAGGPLSDIGAHHFDIAQWAMDMDDSGPISVTPPDDPKATQGAKYQYANGVEMFHGTYAHPGMKDPKTGEQVQPKNGCHFIGTDGYIFVDRREIQSYPAKILETPLSDSDWRLPEIGSSHMRNWVDCIRSGEKPVADVEIGHRTNTVCMLANLAYQLERPLKWDPKTETFADDKEANSLISQKDREPWDKI